MNQFFAQGLEFGGIAPGVLWRTLQLVHNIFIIQLFVKGDCEYAFFGICKDLNDVGSAQFFFLVENIAVVHLILHNVSAHGQFFAGVVWWDDFAIIFVGDVLNLIITRR